MGNYVIVAIMGHVDEIFGVILETFFAIFKLFVIMGHCITMAIMGHLVTR